MEITHQEFITILNEKDKYGKMKENVRNVSEKQENMIIVLIQGLKNVFCVFSLIKMCETIKEAYEECEIEIIDD